MFIFVFFIVVALSQFITNKILNISDDNSVGYTYSKRDSLIILLFLAIAVGLQFIKFSNNKVLLILLAVYFFGTMLTMIILATIKKVIITKQREELQQVFDVLTPVLPKNTELDFNNPPFKLGYEKHQINKIIIEINPNTFKESVATNLCLSLNKYLPNYEWMSEFDFAARECIFVGTPLPPGVAKYPGSWLRPAEFIPIGLSGLGEISWTINSIKDTGSSLYIYDDGKKAKTVDSPSAPQALAVGSPLGLNTIIPTTTGYKTIGTIKVGDEVFGYKNTPVKVLDVYAINKKPNQTYKLTFASRTNTIEVISDEVHRFPVVVQLENNVMKISPVQCKDLIIGSIIHGQTYKEYAQDYTLISKELVDPQPVRCISVDSEQHIFLIVDKKDELWKGGIFYNLPAIYTYNTGGGKAIYIEQEIDIGNKND